MRVLALIGFGFFLSACGGKLEKSPAPDIPRVDHLGGVDLNAPISVVGTEPFWAVTLTEDNMMLERPDQDDVIVPRHAFEVNKDKAGADRAELISNELTLTLIAQTCSDGMSDRSYPLTAELVMGDEVLKGCAITTEALEKSRP